MDNDAKPREVGSTDGLGPVRGVVLDRNGWPTLIVRGNEEAHVKHAGASYLYTLTEEEVAAVNKLRARREWVKRGLHERFQAWRERTGFLMDGHDGGM